MAGDMSQGLNGHGYLQDDMDFDSLINTSSWPTSTTPLNQYSAYQPPPQSHTPQNNYSHYQTTSNQASYQYDVPQSQQNALYQMPYSNSPYSNQPQPQYQQLGRSTSNDYNASNFGLVDHGLQANPYHNATQPYPYAPQQQQQQQPQNAQAPVTPNALYASPANQLHQIARTNSQSPYLQQANGATHDYNQPAQQINGTYYNSFQYGNLPQSQGNPIQYPDLPKAVTEYEPAATKPVVEIPYQNVYDISFQGPANAQAKTPRPSSTLRVYRPELLAKKDTELRNPLNHAPFVVFTSVGGLKASTVSTKGENINLTYKVTANGRVSKVRKSKTGDSSLTKGEPKKRGRPRKDQTSGYQGTIRLPKTKVAKAPRVDGTLSKSASPSETSSSEESSSEDESEYEEEVKLPPVDISTVRQVERPKDPALAAGWDAIGIIWKDPNQSLSQEVVTEAVSKYGQFVMGFRNQIKSLTTKIDEAGEKGPELAQLQKQQSGLLDALYQAIAATLKHGYPFIVGQLGNHHQLVNALIATLRDCIKSNDYTGKLPKATLELLAKFKTLSDELLKKCKLDSVQKRWVKKGDKETNQKFIDIFANTVESQEKSKVKVAEGDKKTTTAANPVKQPFIDPTKPAATNPAKRSLETTVNGNPAKKFAADVSGSAASSAKPVIKKPGANLLGINTRPVAKPVVKPVVKKREPSPPQESKLGALLASIAKPAEAPRPVAAPTRAPETPEEKAKRERKESRRHLRVKFKEGAELEQIKLFKHEQEEDEGRQNEMLRDATDTHNEGMMHKKRAETVDLDDEDYQPPESVEPVFTEPKSIDFSQLPKMSPHGPTYATRGGDLEVQTPEQETQARREGLELLVVYTNPEDIPPSAKEPTAMEVDAPEEPVKLLKQSSTPWHSQRNQELEHYGSDRAYQIFTTRVSIESPEERMRRLYPAGPPQGTQDNLLPSAQDGAKPIEPAFQALVAAFEALSGKPFPATEPPAWMVSPKHRAIWMEGYQRDNPGLQSVITEPQAFVAPPPPNFVPPPNMQSTQSAPPMIPPFPPPPLADIAQHMFAGFGNDKHPPPLPFDYNAWAAANHPQNQPERVEPERSRRDEDEGRSTGKKKKLKNWERFDENGDYKGPKLPCKFYGLGQCRKGADCTYSHDLVPQT